MIGLVLFFLAMGVAVVKLPRGKDPFAPQGPVTRFVGMDVSGSAEPEWKFYCDYAGRLASTLNPKTDAIELFEFAQAVHAFPTQIPNDPESLRDRLWEDLGKVKRDRSQKAASETKGTRPALFLNAVADSLVRNSDERPAEVIMLWDGGDDYLAFQHYDDIFDACVTALASNTRVTKLVVWGVHPENYDTVKKRLNAFGNRLHVFRNDEGLQL